MADLNTNINIVVKNLNKLKSLKQELKNSADYAKAIQKDFERLDNLQKRSRRVLKPLDDIGRDIPRDAKGRFTKDPNRKRRQELYQKGIEKEIRLEQRLQRIRQREIGTNTVVKQEIAHLKERVVQQRLENRELQVKIQRIAKLKAAQGLVSRKLREAGSAGLSPTEFGGTEGKRVGGRRSALNEEVQNIRTGFESLRSAGVKNIETYRALGSQLSRTVEELNALNKASARRSVGFEKGRRLQERIDTVAASGYGKTGQIAAARKSAANVIAAGRTGDQNLYNQALSKATAQVSRLERAYKEAETVQKKASQQAKKAQRRLRNIRKIRQDRNDRMRESLMLGAGFPLLFGGGVGAVAGGVGGALAQRGGKGFGAQILFSAIGQQFDALISSMIGSAKKLGDALGQYTQNTEQLVTSLGLAGTAEGQRIEIIKKLKGEQAAFNAALQRLTSVVGTVGVQRLKDFGDKWRDIMMSFQERMVKLQAALAGVLIVVDKIIGASKVAREDRILAFARQSGDANLKSLVQQYDETPTSYRFRKQRKDLKGQILEQATPGFALQNAQISIDTALMGEKELLKTKKEQFEIDQRIVELKKGGMNEALASEIAKLEQVFNKGTTNLEQQKKSLQQQIRTNGWTDELGVQLKEINKALEERVKLLGMSTEELKKYLATQKAVKDESDFIKVKWEDIKETIASGLTSAVEGLIAGTKTLGESLAGIAKSIASMYLKAAFMNMLPGLPAVKSAEGRYMANGIKPFASGGMATRPTLGLIGEAGEDEYIIPASKMAQSMQRYSAGARGEAVIPGTGSSHAGGGAGGSTTVNYSGPILNFNSEEFVPKSAVGQIIATATSQGARAGENKTLSTLRNSRSARSRLGM